MKKVVIFRSKLLPISETFIHDQARTLSKWTPVLVGLHEVNGGLQTPEVRREIVPGANRRALLLLRLLLDRPLPGLVRLLKQLKVDLVHAHFGTDATDIWPSVKAAGRPMLVTLHGYDISIHREWWEAGHGGPRRRAYPKRLLRMAHDPAVHFIAVSKAIRSRAVAYGIPEEKITVAYIGVDTQRFKPSGLPLDQRSKRILFVGRMVEKKAPLLMIHALAAVRKEVLDAELVMIGDGPLLAAAKRLAAELAVPVRFLGACSSDELLAQLQEARVFCLPSLTAENGDAEGFGLAILEAQACGVPAISSAQGGADEGLLDGETGYAFNEGMLDELVAGLRRLLQDDGAAKRASFAATNFANEMFDIRARSGKLEVIYEEVSTGMIPA
ncbi:glycosyltransferase [Luteimonas sp. R10]|uniref:glycosyltransferase n=1 Tax=Luteimonas sp. R10 TaxID=3108176 RepID=UPI0030881F26|nr:glycosyltransferase [Luteimonas sp. R10]